MHHSYKIESCLESKVCKLRVYIRNVPGTRYTLYKLCLNYTRHDAHYVGKAYAHDTAVSIPRSPPGFTTQNPSSVIRDVHAWLDDIPA